jgi:Xaa-Pro aminopeptidase
MTGLLIHADSVTDADMFVATGVAAGDPFTYLEENGRRIIVTNVLEVDMVRRDSTATDVWLTDEFNLRELVREGMPGDQATMEGVRRAVERAGLSEVRVPPRFPLAVADYLREKGVTVTPDRDAFELRRRAKTPRQLEGMRAAQRATEAAFAASRELLGGSSPGPDGVLQNGGEPVTCERIRALIVETLREHGCEGEPPLVGAGPNGAMAHDLGYGPVHASEPIIIDIFPRHSESRYCADMTRTFCFGEPPELLVKMHDVILEALLRSTEAIRPGVSGRAVWEVSCDVIEAGGFRTVRGVGPGETLTEDFFHGLGHGVGVEVHEAPNLGLSGAAELRPGDVVTVEPGVYRRDFGGVRLEDLVHVTEDGHEVLTDFPYGLDVV